MCEHGYNAVYLCLFSVSSSTVLVSTTTWSAAADFLFYFQVSNALARLAACLAVDNLCFRRCLEQADSRQSSSLALGHEYMRNTKKKNWIPTESILPHYLYLVLACDMFDHEARSAFDVTTSI